MEKSRKHPEPSPNRRSYHQFCGMAKALDAVGERWTLLIVRDLLLGPWRFSDLENRLSGITPNLLSKRLSEMEAMNLIRKRRLPAPGRTMVYELTEEGESLEPVCLALSQFGFRFLGQDPNPKDKRDISLGILSLKVRYLGKGEGALQFLYPDSHETHQIRFHPKRVEVRYGQPFEIKTKVRLSQSTLRSFLFYEASAEKLERSGAIVISGPKKDWKSFRKAFGLRK